MARVYWVNWLAFLCATMGYMGTLSSVYVQAFRISLPSGTKSPVKIYTADMKDGRHTKEMSILKEKIAFTVDVEFPPGIFQYNKRNGFKGEEKFQLKTPLEKYTYKSKGCVNLPSVQIEFLVESYYEKDHTCFALYFLSSKVKRKFLAC